MHVVPVGDLDIAVAPAVDAQLSELHDVGFRRLVLDLRQVTFIDARGLRLILNWTEVARARTTTFEVIAGPPNVQRIFALTDTADQIAFVEAERAQGRRFVRPS